MQQQDLEKLEFPAYGLLLLEAASRMAPIDSGAVTSPADIGSNVLNAGDKNWPVGKLAHLLVVIYEGAGKGQFRVILRNTANTLVVEGAWDVALNETSRYKIAPPFDLRQALRDVLGGGHDISATNPLQVYDPKVGSLISFSGTTTADGAGDGSTLICAGLTTEADFNGNLVIITSGAYQGQARDINGVTTGGTVTPASAFGGQIVEGTTFTIVGIRTVPAEVAALTALVAAIQVLANILDLTQFTQEAVGATVANGATWVDILDRSATGVPITKPTEICGFMVTVAGGWAGNARIRIVDGAGNKIFPFQAYYEEGTDFASGAQAVFNFKVVVPIADGYKLQFCSSNGADGAGKTLQLNNLDVIERG